jgi:geranylgeranyl pyrophosphate synthase
LQIETTNIALLRDLSANILFPDEAEDSNASLVGNSLQYRSLLQEELREVNNLMLESHSQTPRQVSQAIGCIINSGGKRLRPALVLLSAHLCGADVQQAIPLAAAVEMLHTATLIHDDLIDKASVRRGVKTLNARWPPSATVLAGDIAFAWAANLATQGKNIDLIVRFCEVLEIICNGELLQIFGEQEIPLTPKRKQIADLDACFRAYYARTFAKTASLFALAAEVGPRLTNAPQKEIQKLQDFGKLVGQAFQIADDVLDLMGTEELLGKPVGSDLRQGLVTLPVLRYLEAYPEDDRVLKILHSKNKLEEERNSIQEFIADFRRSDIAKQVMEEAANQVETALNHLSAYPSTPYRQAMEEIATFAVRRRY